LAANNQTNQDAIREAGGLAPLVELLGAGAESMAAQKAAGALANLASNSTNKDAIRTVGGIPRLVELLRAGARSRGPYEAAQHAAAVLANLASNATNKDAIREAGGIDALVGMLRPPPLAYYSASQQVAGALANLAANNPANQDAVREAGGIASLIALLEVPAGDRVAQGGQDAAQQAAGTLWNLAANNQTNQDAIREANGIPPLVALLCQGVSSAASQKAAGALANLAAGHRNQEAIREAGAMPHLVELVRAGETSEAAQQAAGALRNLAANNTANKDAVREAGGIAPLIALLGAGQHSLSAQKAAGALRNLAANNTANQDLIRESDGLRHLVELLRAGPQSVAAQESAAALANLAAGNVTNKDAIRDAGAIPPLLQLLQPQGTEVAQHAFAALANVLSPVMALLQPAAALVDAANATPHMLAYVASNLSGFRTPEDGLAVPLTGDGTGGTGSFAPPHNFLARMQESAARRLQMLLDGSADVLDLTRALERARALQLPPELIATAEKILHAMEEENSTAQRRRADAIEADAVRSLVARKRLQDLGCSENTLRVPPEFICPITQEKMLDPVVASDGHSYERDAIAHVLFRSNGLSPLTRERLRCELFPNIALRKQIAEYEQEVAGILERFVEDQKRVGSSSTEASYDAKRPHERAGDQSSEAGEAAASRSSKRPRRR